MSFAPVTDPPPVIHLSETLGIQGWQELDAVILAALATESPLLMIGRHGTAKTQMALSVAQSLGLNTRHYNASMLNYDDIVGIPVPDETGTELTFIKSPGNIWEAEFVFLDEISRCRPDLQNKLFPIVYDKMVVGMPLTCLRFRWAAMNPPASNDPTANDEYLGSEPLDPALADRFPFVLMAPTWETLSLDERRALIRGDRPTDNTTLDLAALVAETALLIPQVEESLGKWLPDYIVCLMDLLGNNGLAQSGRRARMLARNVAAIHAARLVLNHGEADIDQSAETAVLYGIPQTATDKPPAEIRLIALHKQAFELVYYLENDSWRQIVNEPNPARRLVLADGLGFDDETLSRLITQTLSTEDNDLRQIGLAVGVFYRFGQTRDLDPSAFEPIAQLAYHLNEPRLIKHTLQPDTPEMTLWEDILKWIEEQGERVNSPLFWLQRNFLLYGFPAFWIKTDWRTALNGFTQDLAIFGITDAAKSE